MAKVNPHQNRAAFCGQLESPFSNPLSNVPFLPRFPPQQQLNCVYFSDGLDCLHLLSGIIKSPVDISRAPKSSLKLRRPFPAVCSAGTVSKPSITVLFALEARRTRR